MILNILSLSFNKEKEHAMIKIIITREKGIL